MKPKLTYDDLAGISLVFYHKFFMRILGIRLGPKSPKPTLQERLKRSLSYFVWAVIIYDFFAIVLGTFALLEKKNMKEIAHNLCGGAIHLNGVLKFAGTMYKQSAMVNVTTWGKEVKRNNEETFLEKFIRVCNYVIYWNGQLCVYLWLFLRFYTGKDQLIALYPLMNPDVPRYVKDIIHQSATAIYCYNNLFLGIFLNTHEVLLIVEARRLSKNWAALCYDPNEPDHFRSEFIKHHTTHVHLNTMFQQVNEVHNIFFGCQILNTIIILGVTVIAVFKSPEPIVTFMAMAPLFTLILNELILYCVLGEEMTKAFESFSGSIALTNWFEIRVKDRVHVILLLEVMKKRKTLTGAKIIVAKMTLLIEVAKHVFSLITLMKAIGQETKGLSHHL